MNANAVIFDFGNVLGTFDKMQACERFAEESTYPAETIYTIITEKLEKKLESGAMSDTAFCNELLHECKIERLTVPDVQRIWGDIFEPNPMIDPVIDQLIAQKTPVAVLSNTNGIHWPYITELPVMRKLRQYGAPFVLSYEIKAFKPAPRMYEAALSALNTKASSALYLDDVQEYVDAARKMGMQAAWYNCTKDAARIHWIMSSFGLITGRQP